MDFEAGIPFQFDDTIISMELLGFPVGTPNMTHGQKFGCAINDHIVFQSQSNSYWTNPFFNNSILYPANQKRIYIDNVYMLTPTEPFTL